MNSLLDQAMAHHRCGRLDAAEHGFRTLLAVDPDHADALHLLGVALCQQGRKIEALRWIEQAIKRRPEIGAYHGARGEVLRELGRDEEAMVELASALELDPSLATVHNNMGLVHLRAGRADLALACFDEAIRLRPAFSTARINRGETLGVLGRWDDAAAAYREVLELEPENASVHAYLGYVLVECGDVDRLEEAAAHCQRALALAPELAQAHSNLGTVWVAMNRLDDAVAAFGCAIELDPALGMPWNNIGRAYQQLGRFDDALAAYHEALAREPRSARFHANLARLLAEQGRDTDAVERFRIALECDPNHAESWCGIGQSLLTLGDRASARHALEEAIRLRPALPAPRLALARVRAEDGDFGQSNDLARTVLARYPKSALALYQLALNERERLDDDALNAMIALVDQPGFDDVAVASLAFGIGTVLDGRRHFAEAARFFAMGNERQSRYWSIRSQPIEPIEDPLVIEQTIASFRHEFFRSVHGRGSPSRKPVFIVGMPRSGTTLTEQVLASHPSVFGAGELNDMLTLARKLAAPSGGPPGLVTTLLGLDTASFRAHADRHVVRLTELGGHADHVVDKMPSNLLHLGLIAALWPEAKIIVCRRDPRRGPLVLDNAVRCDPLGQ